MPFQPVLNTAQLTAIFRLANGKRAQFSFYANNDAANWDAAQLAAAATALSNAITTDYIPALSVDHSFLGVEARDLEVEFGRVESDMEAAPVAGTLASPSLPAQNAVVGTLKSATGQPRRGRVYLLPPTEGQVAGSDLNAGAVTALQAALQSMHDAIDGLANTAHVIVSRYDGTETYAKTSPSGHELTLERPKKRVNAIVANVATVQVKSRVDTQRRRLSREGA